MTAIWTFLSTTWGRRIALIAAVFVLCGLGAYCHGKSVSRFGTERYDAGARDEADRWRKKLGEAEQAARDTIRRKEAAAYQRGIADETARRALDSADAEKAETIVKEIVHVSQSAAACRYDDASVAALNRLRRGQD